MEEEPQSSNEAAAASAEALSRDLAAHADLLASTKSAINELNDRINALTSEIDMLKLRLPQI